MPHQRLELPGKRVSRGVFAKKQPGDRRDDQQDGGERGDGIECHRGAAAEGVVLDEGGQSFFQQGSGVFEHAASGPRDPCCERVAQRSAPGSRGPIA